MRGSESLLEEASHGLDGTTILIEGRLNHTARVHSPKTKPAQKEKLHDSHEVVCHLQELKSSQSLAGPFGKVVREMIPSLNNASYQLVAVRKRATDRVRYRAGEHGIKVLQPLAKRR